eukprot:TRINITY_DN19481_c0_g1_i1.p1 TRINITY_DN19481_c0_g1~~TRINITY_DN19481_c0_g1_i1.p1  ORF type:complete len:286 (-),score=62.73 TRINITY_DN19481_c0_g1_i1:162-1019(-)
MDGAQLKGTVKAFKGSFGWLVCPEVAEKFSGRDVFLHKNVVNTVPTVGSIVKFRLKIDEKGNPKAEDAAVEVFAEPLEQPTSAAKKIKKDSAEAPSAAGGEGGKMAVKRAALMLFRGDEVLVVREVKKGEGGKPQWSDLGGKVEPGEEHLDCALRELAEEAEGFMTKESIALVQTGLRQRFAGGEHKPEIVALKATGDKPQAMAIFPMDCTGVELELLTPEKPNTWGVHEMRWVSRSLPDFRNRSLTRWPLLRAMCTLGKTGSKASNKGSADRPRSRSRSRSPKK